MKSPGMWKAIILIGGPEKGTRFRPLSMDSPKPLFPIAGYPIIQHHIETCAKVNEIREIILIGFFPRDEKLNSFINEMREQYSVIITYLPEHTALGTAGGLYHYRDQIKAGSPTAFFVFNADVCCNFNLKEIMEFHLEVTLPGGITMVATEATKQESIHYGCVVVDRQSCEATHYVEKPETFVSTLINCGVYVFSLDVLDTLSTVYMDKQAIRYVEGNENSNDEKLSLEIDVLTNYASSGKMFVFKTSGVWGQIKSAASAIYANKLYLSDYHNSHPERLARLDAGDVGPKIEGDVFIHPQASVDPTATLGPNVTIEKGAKIGPGVRVCNSIVLADAEIKAHSCILNTIIGWGSVVGEWSRVEGTAQQPNPNAPFSKIVSGNLFDDDGRLIPSITVLGRDVKVSSEIIVLNSIVLPNKEITKSSKNQIML